MTSACGIDCSVCRLKLQGSCSGCGPGKSIEATRKLAAQKRILGNTCAILSCAVLNNVDYCMRDCSMFPCSNYFSGYPYGEQYLSMQKRRRSILPVALTPSGEPIDVPDEYWSKLSKKDPLTICNMTMVEPVKGVDYSNSFIFDHLNKKIVVDSINRSINYKDGNNYIKIEDPLLELLTVLYLTTIEKFRLYRNELTTVNGLKQNMYFTGTYSLKTDGVRERFETDLQGFRENAINLGGVEMKMADVAFKFTPFPRIPVYYLLWAKNSEYGGRVSILFERSIENYFTASAIWALVNLINRDLIMGYAL